MTDSVIIRCLNRCEYHSCWQAMKQFTDKREADTGDEIWLLEHFPVFTQGQSGKSEHILQTSSIPIVRTDRGGQVTYHGPGQWITYVLIDLNRKKWNIRTLVTLLENTVIDFLHSYHIPAAAKREAPGVYCEGKKIASIGLRVRRGCSYHGLAVNMNMDLTPFNDINPCGYAGLKMTQLADLIDSAALKEKPPELKLVEYLATKLGYNTCQYTQSEWNNPHGI